MKYAFEIYVCILSRKKRDENDEIMLKISLRSLILLAKIEIYFFTLQEHLENCEFGDILCINDCGAKFQKRFLQKHLDKDCPKKIIACSYCDDRHLREDKKEHIQECPKIPLPCPNKCDKSLSIPRDEVRSSVETTRDF